MSVRRFGGLALLPFISLLVPFLILPIISRTASQGEVAALGIGDSIGAMVALIGAYGWPLTGPARVANLSPLRAAHAFAESIVPRLIILLIALLPAGLLAAVLAPADSFGIVALAVLASAVGALSPSWFLVGRSQPALLAVYDTVPRALAGLGAVVLVATTKDVIWYPMCLLVGTCAGQIAFMVRTGAVHWVVRRSSWQRAGRVLQAEIPAALAMVSGGVYSSATVSLVAIGGSVQVVAVYGMADRLFKASLTAVVASANAVQGWVSEDSSHQSLAARGRRAVVVLGGIGAVGAVGIAALAPWVTEWFFGPEYRIEYLASSMIGLAFLSIALNTALGRLILVPFGQVRTVTASTVVGAIFGVPAIIVGAWLGEVAGAAAGFAVSEALVTAVQAVAVMGLRRRLMIAPSERPADL
ncbi:hypothetical protein [Microbacterium sp. OR16]|uniref:hypothetical protein n=1 Tax=Microbacterium sp. OR16 TaxID=3095345 RepID=UPI0039B6134C